MDNVTETMKSTMCSATKALPAQTIDNICQYLASDGILSLRAVSDTFLSRFYTHRRQLISKPSLKQFLDISAHPALRQNLKSVEFVRAELNPRWKRSYGTNRDHFWPGDSSVGLGTGEEHVNRVGWLGEEKQVVNKWSMYEKELGNLLDLEEITLALQNLKFAGITPALLVSGDLWGASPAHGVHGLHRLRTYPRSGLSSRPQKHSRGPAGYPP
ncbi:hypothetical protein AC579_5594 [Pseudocercospora musae]|uniref:F-box domain-containing protein n=1 Tax=Pseudocercospora musae TaxID=113226 RepID=A0A139INK2_9PEZI|nr:hypothetical protein AC579_5594 [Pseudocercospora musae]